MTNKSRSLNVYLGEQKESWIEYCESIGKKPGVALKEAIEKQLEDFVKPKEKLPLKKSVEALQKEKKFRVEILLTESEKEAVNEWAKHENCSSRRWMVDAIRSRLTHEPQLSMPEIEALGESNYLLLAIGRNLNQITRRLNNGNSDLELMDVIDMLKQKINNHTDLVSRTIRSNIERWSIK
mgnify:CR=1 FL=1